MVVEKNIRFLKTIDKLGIYGHMKNSFVNCHYFKLMIINNCFTSGHQTELYGHAYPMNLKKEK